MQESQLIALPQGIRPVSFVRSTLIQSSLNSLRDRGHFDRYASLVSPLHKESILGTLAPEWLPLDVGLAHYEACEALRLSPHELLEVGEAVGNRIQGTFIGTLVKRARTVGLTPWVPLGQFDRLWSRLMQGGAVGLTQKGPKDAVVEVRLLPLARFAYFRAAFCGVIASGIKLGGGRAAYVKEATIDDVEKRLLFTAAWV